MTKLKKNTSNKYESLNTLFKKYGIKSSLEILAVTFITSFWIFLITGSANTSVVYFTASALTLVTNFIITNKFTNEGIITPKTERTLSMAVFILISIIAFVVSASVGDEVFALFATIIWTFFYIRHKASKNKKELIAGAIIPFAIILYSEYMQNTFSNAWYKIFDSELTTKLGYLIGVIFIIYVSSLFNKMFNNKKIGYYATGIIFGLLSIINFFVYAYTEQPFTISDLKIATTAAGVLKTQGLEAENWLRFVIGILILVLYFVIITFTYQNKKIHQKKRWRIISVTFLCAMGIGLYSASSILSSHMLLYQGHMKYGFVGNFYITINNNIEIPKDADEYVIEDISDEVNYKPNVIIIMNEAFSDLEKTFDLTLNEDPIPYFHSLQEKYPHGITYSSVKGNNTCSSEWELLSGSPTALTAKGAMIYRDNNKPMRSIVSLFNDRGYTTTGLHPYFGFGYNRDNIYHNLGFNQTMFIEDMPQGLETHRTFVTDEENYKMLIKMYEENEAAGDKPFFCFNITMQNHGNYVNLQSNEVYPTEGKSFTDVNTYLSGLKYSDEALKTLISYFESVEEDTIILFFGDHQPMIENVFYEEIYNKPYEDLTLQELTKVYAVPYLIWANYDINKEAAPKTTSNCYLTNILFEVGNLPKSTWHNMIDKYQENYPIITEQFTMDAQGTLHETSALLKNKENEPEDFINLYQKYSYGILCGKE